MLQKNQKAAKEITAYSHEINSLTVSVHRDRICIYVSLKSS